MFHKKKELPSPKPDPPRPIESLLMVLITVCFLGFSFSVSTLRDINYHLRHEETNQETSIPEIPITTYSR